MMVDAGGTKARRWLLPGYENKVCIPREAQDTMVPIRAAANEIDAGAKPPPLTTVLLWTQGLYYLLTWPLVSIETFQWVTGPKTDHLITGRESDHWLVMTVGVLVTAISITLLLAAWRGRKSPEAAVLAVLSAIGLAAIDVIYVYRGVLYPIYLADAAAEAALLMGWSIAFLQALRARVPSVRQ